MIVCDVFCFTDCNYLVSLCDSMFIFSFLGSICYFYVVFCFTNSNHLISLRDNMLILCFTVSLRIDNVWKVDKMINIWAYKEQQTPIMNRSAYLSFKITLHIRKIDQSIHGHNQSINWSVTNIQQDQSMVLTTKQTQDHPVMGWLVDM